MPALICRGRPRLLSACLLAAVVAGMTGRAGAQESAASNNVSALPFPLDATELEFDTTFEDIEFVSRSPLSGLAAFYREQMTARGWKEDESQTSIEADEVELTFQRGDAEVVVELSNDSDGEVDVSLDCEGLEWSGVNDPVALAKAGVPQPRAFLFVQSEFPFPQGAEGFKYQDGACECKCPLDFPDAAEQLRGALSKLGFREDVGQAFLGKYIHGRTYRRGPVTLEVRCNKNHQAPGCWVKVAYASTEKEPLARPLAAVALPGLPAGAAEMADKPADGATPAAAKSTPVVVSNNRGVVTVVQGGNKHVLRHAAAFKSRDYGDRTTLVFSSEPIPLRRMQQMLAKDESFSFGDLFDFNLPTYMTILAGDKNVSFTFSAPGLGIGNSAEHVANELAFADGRVRGSIKTTQPEDIFDEPFTFAAEIDAGIMRSDTHITDETGAPPPALPADSALDASRGLPAPRGATNVQSVRSKYRQQVDADVETPLADIVALYRGEAAGMKWRERESDSQVAADTARMVFDTPSGPVTMHIEQAGDGSKVHLSSRDEAAAKRDGLLPEPGKARLVMGNAFDRDIVISIGKTEYPIKAGRGAENPKTALNYSVPPGKYKLTIKIPGQSPEVEEIDVAAGTAWGVLGLPTGGYFAEQLF